VQLQVDTSGGLCAFVPRSSGSISDCSTTGIVIADGAWHQVAASWSAADSRMRLWVDGQSSDVTSRTFSTFATSSPLYFGGAATAAASPVHFTGRVDEVRARRIDALDEMILLDWHGIMNPLDELGHRFADSLRVVDVEVFKLSEPLDDQLITLLHTDALTAVDNAPATMVAFVALDEARTVAMSGGLLSSGWGAPSLGTSFGGTPALNLAMFAQGGRYQSDGGQVSVHIDNNETDPVSNALVAVVVLAGRVQAVTLYGSGAAPETNGSVTFPSVGITGAIPIVATVSSAGATRFVHGGQRSTITGAGFVLDVDVLPQSAKLNELTTSGGFGSGAGFVVVGP
jgi:hypothetical protein